MLSWRPPDRQARITASRSGSIDGEAHQNRPRILSTHVASQFRVTSRCGDPASRFLHPQDMYAPLVASNDHAHDMIAHAPNIGDISSTIQHAVSLDNLLALMWLTGNVVIRSAKALYHQPGSCSWPAVTNPMFVDKPNCQMRSFSSYGIQVYERHVGARCWL